MSDLDKILAKIDAAPQKHLDAWGAELEERIPKCIFRGQHEEFKRLVKGAYSLSPMNPAVISEVIAPDVEPGWPRPMTELQRDILIVLATHDGMSYFDFKDHVDSEPPPLEVLKAARGLEREGWLRIERDDERYQAHDQIDFRFHLNPDQKVAASSMIVERTAQRARAIHNKQEKEAAEKKAKRRTIVKAILLFLAGGLSTKALDCAWDWARERIR